MIERYGREVMRQVWTEENKFDAYLKVELLAAEAWRELGVVPAEDVEKLWAKATFNIDRIKEIELQTRHDIVAFTRTVSDLRPSLHLRESRCRCGRSQRMPSLR